MYVCMHGCMYVCMHVLYTSTTFLRVRYVYVFRLFVHRFSFRVQVGPEVWASNVLARGAVVLDS